MVFLLGIERSATTWVSNILDMHPGTELYMEPLSENISRLEHWPHRFTEIEDLSQKAQYFRKEFSSLQNRKKFLFNRVSEANWAWEMDMMIARKLWQYSAVARDFFELHFHRRETTNYPPKNKQALQIIKELRLNFNVPVIKEIDPDVKIVVVLRNYAANIQSISNQFQKGNLKELNKLLKQKYGEANINTIFEFWADNYNSLLRGLDSGEIDYTIVNHEDLITSGKKTVDHLFDFLGLQPVPAVYNYLVASNANGSGKHSTKRSHTELLEKNRQAERVLYPKLVNRVAEIDWHPVLQNLITKQ